VIAHADPGTGACADGVPVTARFVFALEQTLGHAAHSRNIERALAMDMGIDATVIRLDRRARSGPWRLPGVRTWSFQASLTARRALTSRIGQGPVDAIFVHTQVASLLSVRVMRTVPTVVSLDATPVNFDQEGHAYGHHRQSDVIELLKRRVNRRSLHEAAALVTWCEWAAASLVSDYGVPRERIHVIPPGVDLDLFCAGDRRRTGPVRVLFVGADFERKGGPDLLEAMRTLGDRAELDVVTTSDVGRIPPGVTCRVHRRLSPQAPHLLNLYREADVFALPSRGDCMPQALAEALASGLPVVATSVGAIGEMVRDDVNGYLVPPRQPGVLATALVRLAVCPDRRVAFGRAGRVLAELEHDALRNNRAIFELMTGVARR